MTPGDRTLALRTSRRISLLRGVRREALVGWLFVLPALVMYALFVLQPLFLTVQYSFYRWDGVGPATWIGLSNYATVLSDPEHARDDPQRLPAGGLLQLHPGDARAASSRA